MKSIRLRIDRNAVIKVSGPHFLKDAEIFRFLDDKREWIEKKLALVKEQVEPEEIVDGSLVQVWGENHLVRIAQSSKNSVSRNPDTSEIHFTQRQITPEITGKLLNELYRSELKKYIETALPEWEQTMSVSCSYWNVKNMRSKWGSCNVLKKRIWLNLNLTKYPKECAQMVLVHELAHLIEASHNKRFYQLMDTHLPDWKGADRLLGFK